MPTIEQDGNELIIDPSAGAGRISLHPREWQKGNSRGGHYRVGFQTGLTTGVSAAGALLSIRWTTPDLMFRLLRLLCSATITTAFGTGQENSVDLVRVTGMTADDSGGTDRTATVRTSGRKSTLMAHSQVGSVRTATTAAMTKTGGTEESLPVGMAVVPVTNVVGVAGNAVLFDAIAGHEAPIDLRDLEGLRARILTAQGATGVVRWSFVLDWAEVPIAY